MLIKGKDELKEGFFGMIVTRNTPVRLELPAGCSLQLCSATFTPFDSIGHSRSTMALLVKVDASPPIALASAVTCFSIDYAHIDHCKPLTHRFSDTDGSLLFTIHCDPADSQGRPIPIAVECHVAGHITRQATVAAQAPVQTKEDEVVPDVDKLQLRDITSDRQV